MSDNIKGLVGAGIGLGIGLAIADRIREKRKKKSKRMPSGLTAWEREIWKETGV